MENTYIDYDYTVTETSAQTTAINGVTNVKDMMIFSVIAMVLLVTIIIMLVFVIRKLQKIECRVTAVSVKIGKTEGIGKSDELGVVFCKKCGSQYSVVEKNCPYCGEKR